MRLASQIQNYQRFVANTNQSLETVVDFLNQHPKVGCVYWPYQESNQGNYEQIAGTGKSGCMVSFTICGSFEKFYDHVHIFKSPSFGTEFSICCPYVYLAHYNLMKTKAGRKELDKAKIPINLIRLSVGQENPSDIISCLDEALLLT